MATHRTDYSFRGKLYGTFPLKDIDAQPRFKLVKGQTYKFEVSIDEEICSLKVDGKLYYTSIFPAGIVPKHGYFGFTSYSGNGSSQVNYGRVTNPPLSRYYLMKIATVSADKAACTNAENVTNLILPKRLYKIPNSTEHTDKFCAWSGSAKTNVTIKLS